MTERIENEDDLRQVAEPSSSPPGTTSDMTAHLCASGHNQQGKAETGDKCKGSDLEPAGSGFWQEEGVVNRVCWPENKKA